MNPSPPDLFPQRPVRSDFARAPSYRTRRIITVSVVAVLAVAGLHFALGWPSFSHSGEIATIKAEGPWKQKPEQPGGLDIPNQNVQVYQALDNKDDTAQPVEHLLPPPEVPQPVPMPANGVPPVPPTANATPPQVETLTPPKLDIDTITTTASPVDTTVTPPPPVATAPPPAPEPAPAPVATAAPPTPAPAPPPVVKAAPVVKAKTPAPTIAQVLKDAENAPKSSRVVQLASVPDQASAQSMADNLQSKYASILGSAQLRVVEADVAGKVTYYRIQSQPLAGDRAGSICDALKKMKAGCILVRP